MKHTLADQVPVAVTMDDGSTAILSFMVRGSSPTLPYGARWEDGRGTTGIWVREPTDANVFAELSKACPAMDQLGVPKPQPVRYRVVERESIPKDRTYRDALRHTDQGFHHDLARAKELHLDKIRRARTAAIGELDKDWMKATGRGDQQAAADVEAQRQVLRDLPATLGIAEARTVDELKGCWPAELPPL
jgi:hypothetical protein